MEKEAQKFLDTLTAKDIHELSDTDIAFLKARQSYLSAEFKAKFASILEEKVEKEVTDTKKKK